MKDKKHIGGLAEFVALDLEDFAWRIRNILVSASDMNELRHGVEMIAQDMEGVAAISRGAIAGRILKAAAQESSTNAQNRAEKDFTLELVRGTLEIYRKKRMEEIKANPLARYPEIGWKSGLAKAFNIKSYAHTLKPKLLGLGITEAQIVAYLKTGQWW